MAHFFRRIKYKILLLQLLDSSVVRRKNLIVELVFLFQETRKLQETDFCSKLTITQSIRMF